MLSWSHPFILMSFTPKAMGIVSYSFLLTFLFSNSPLPCLTTAKVTKDINTDRSVLLTIKSHLNLDPYHILSKSWSNSTHVCNWIGVTCSPRHQRVSALDISSMAITATLPPHIGNLSFLVSLNISHNHFHGGVPQELNQLRRLRVVKFMVNRLTGEIPSWFGALPHLQILSLMNNSFQGVIPHSLSNISNLEVLDLAFNQLHGKIPKGIGNLQNLRIFIALDNQLTGSLPPTLSNASKLEVLSLEGNNLTGNIPTNICCGTPRIKLFALHTNGLTGKLPANYSHCSELQILSLSFNKFSGTIPREIGDLRSLKMLYLASNSLTGSLPKELGNITNLEELNMQENLLVGSIQSEIFNISSLKTILFGENKLSGIPTNIMCPRLEILDLSKNELNGHIPKHIFNKCSTLQYLSLWDNKLQGTIPREIGNSSMLSWVLLGSNSLQGIIPQELGNLDKLEVITLHDNKLSGSIPKSLLNISTLEELAVSQNQLTGDLASDMGYGLPKLHRLALGSNKFKSASPELRFITSFTNLKRLSMSDNPLQGRLPVSIGNRSNTLEYLLASSCQITGIIPDEIGNLSNLLSLQLDGNLLSGSLPKSLGSLRSLQGLHLGRNNIKGTIPTTICELQNLSELALDGNQLQDAIPNCIGSMAALRKAYLNSSKLISTIPSSLWLLKDLLELNLSSNSLTGSLSPSIGNLKLATQMDLSMNQFSGVIPSTIDSLQAVSYFSIANNRIQGSIPESIASMWNLEALYLSHNNLSGSIPISLERLQYLKHFDVSFNDLSGEIPSDGPFRNFTSQSFLFNKGLCGDQRFHVPPCNHLAAHKHQKRESKLRFVFIFFGSLTGVLGGVLAYVFARYKSKQSVTSISQFWSHESPLRVSYYELVKATDGYNRSNLLGSGSFGCVYRGMLKNGNNVAVKVFNLQSEGAFRSFEVECEVLRNLRHRNLCKVISSCSKQDFKALILEYMPNGSLEKWLYSHNFLDINQRINIMIDVASALEYLHHGCSTPVVHSDLKPSNILLDEHMTAYLSDFGVAKLVSERESCVQTMTLATMGYIAPEFGLDGLVSIRSDVYSYGIMLMEVFTRKKPSDELFSLNLSLRSWIEDSMPDGIIHIVDSNLLRPNEEDQLSEKLNCLSSIMKLALNCTMGSPYKRIGIKDVTIALKKIRFQLLGALV